MAAKETAKKKKSPQSALQTAPLTSRGASAEKTKKENKSETKTKGKSPQSALQTAPLTSRGASAEKGDVRKGRQTPTAGVPINVAKEYMGHADISVTAKIYTHMVDEVFEQNRERLESYNSEKFGIA